MKDSIKKNKSKSIMLIKKSNDLIESRYKFDVWEMRFFLSVLAKIEKQDEDFEVYRIKYRDVIKDFGIKSNRSYELLKQAALSILKKSVTIKYEFEGTTRAKVYNILRQIDYLDDAKGKNPMDYEYIDVTVEPELKPFLLQLSKNFTAYELRNVAKLGAYAIRIYELLKQYEFIGKRTMKIDEMKKMLEIENEYPLFANFFQRIIQPAVTEINKHTDIKVTKLDKIKDGKKVVELMFRFVKNPQDNTKKTEEEPQEEPTIIYEPKRPTPKTVVEEADFEEIETADTEGVGEEVDQKERLVVQLSNTVVIKFGVSLKMFMALVEKHSEEDIKQAVFITEKTLQAGKVSNPAGFFVEALRGKYQDSEAQKKALEAQQIAEQRAKTEALRQAAQAQEQAKNDFSRRESDRKMQIIRNLIEEDAELLYEALERMKTDVLGRNYDNNKTVEENMKSPMLAGVLMNYLVKLDPTIFD
jgi:plasmid replication initiation protein